MRNGKVILLFFFSVLTSHAFPRDYNFRNFGAEDGLSQSFIYSILQDAHGYLWIGTDNGLSRYNGFVFENFTTSDSLADNSITCSINDGEYLWFGHRNGRISFYDGKKFSPADVPQPITNPVTQFAKSPDNQIWAGTYSDGLLRLGKQPGNVDHYMFKDQTFIISFDFLDDSDLFVGTNTGLLFCRLKDPGMIEIIRTVKEIPESKIAAIQKMRTGSGFYIATESDGVFRLTKEDNRFKVSGIIADPDSDLTGIQDIYEDSQSNLWLASFGNGLIKMNFFTSGELTKIDYFNNSGQFVTNNVKTVFEDREGIIWSGNYGEGLTQITPKTFSVYTFDKNLYGNNIFSIWSDKEYRWIGTENGLVKLDQPTGKIVRFYSKGSGLPKDTVTAIYSTDGKELWIGTEKNGVFRMETGKGRIIKYPVGNGTLENSVTAIAGKGEEIWIGTKKGLCNINSLNGEINWYSISQGGLPHNFIRCLFIDRIGKLWISTRSNILTYIINDKIFKVQLSSGSGVLTLGPISEDENSQIWVGSIGNGVFRVDADSIINFTTKEGLLSNYCYSLIFDDDKNLWIGHKGGLSRIRTTDFSVKPVNQIELLTDSYQFNSNAINKDQQGKIWFGSSEGMISYDQSMESPKLLPPVLGITSIRINDEEIEYTDKIILSPGNYKLRIDFLGINLKEPSLVTYQYQLEGYDQSPEITKNTYITYNRLTEGDYKFVLRASSGDGVVSVNPLTVNIIIKKPIWKKLWFYLVDLLLLIILTYIYIKRRERKFLAEKRILEEKVKERTYEIQCQKNEIEQQRDLIDEKNENITSSIRYASNIQNAVLPSFDLIDKLLPDNFILFKPKDIVSGDFFWLTEKDNKIVFTVADCTGHGVPGAFMSLLGITLLNEIVNIQGITRSDAIVNSLRERVIQSLQLNQKIRQTKDGMDITLCVLDKKEKRIQFTGGMNELVYIRDGRLETVKADSISVCIPYDNPLPFTMKEIDYREGDIFYLFSDGYQDQFGGESERKFLRKHFYVILLEIHKLPMSRQREILDEKITDWIKDDIQTDDITVMGVRL